MFLIDKPYISNFLIQTIKKNNYPILATKEAQELILDKSLNWISEEEAVNTINNVRTPIYLSSENAIAWINKNLANNKIQSKIDVFKDKFKFRNLIKDIYPNFFFKTVKLDQIQNIDIKTIKLPFVIKPSLGFFSLGVHIIHSITDWEKAKKELNYKSLKSIYPKEVLDTSTFIIEEYINGEEYAIDCYFNNKGKVVILNILHHKFSSGTDISDRVYSTSVDIIKENKKNIENFLQAIGDKVDLNTFPMHVEIRIDNDGTICPIEINPLRFGGWCTTGDLTWYAYAVNSYEYFINNKEPNWDKIYNEKSGKKYSIVLLNNNSGYKINEIDYFDYNLLKKDLENVLVTRKLDIRKYSVFGFIFIETSFENEKELDKILVSDLRKYIVLK